MDGWMDVLICVCIHVYTYCVYEKGLPRRGRWGINRVSRAHFLLHSSAGSALHSALCTLHAAGRPCPPSYPGGLLLTLPTLETGRSSSFASLVWRRTERHPPVGGAGGLELTKRTWPITRPARFHGHELVRVSDGGSDNLRVCDKVFGGNN
jgi:hypothetical protein